MFEAIILRALGFFRSPKPMSLAVQSGNDNVTPS